MQIQQNAFHAKGNIIMLYFNCQNPHGKKDQVIVSK